MKRHIRRLKMIKELEALARIKNAPTIYVGCASDIYTRYYHEYKLIETTLKAFEIIKNHKLLNYVLKNEKCASMYHLSKEEKDLLKEVLL